ncbi:response regulator [Paraburkholderia fungorum]|uniref:response regulator n=1 Tax=Paraburkholderia fungorum TaxID=134537 RepID=UPI00338DD1C3
MKPSEPHPLILLADDDEQTAAAWTAVLRLNGFDVVWAPDGASAWALARTARPDLLLTDWNMPGIDGPELCRIFRADPTLASVPIVLASSQPAALFAACSVRSVSSEARRRDSTVNGSLRACDCQGSCRWIEG